MSVADLARFFSTHELTKSNPLGAWRRFASWQIRSLFQDEIDVPWIAGLRLAVKRGMRGATGNIYTGLHELAEMTLLLHFLRDGDLFLDVGANAGTFSVLASGVCGARSWAFEPDPAAAAALRRNTALNGLESLISLHEVALGAEEGEVAFTVGLDTVNRVNPAPGQPSRTVRQTTLSKAAGAERPVMMKLDVEGYEDAVLAGAAAVLSCPSLKVIEIETVTPFSFETLTANGFERIHYDPWTRQLSQHQPKGPRYNALFVRDRSDVQSRLTVARAVEVLGYSI